MPRSRPTFLPAAVLLLACAATTQAEQQWLTLTTANFELYTAAGERNGRDLLRQFEQIRGFFLKATNITPPAGARVRIVAFDSDKEYKPYRLSEAADAYYLAGPERDTIVMGRAGGDVFPLAVHEYVHLIIRHAGTDLPTWLDEGMADLFSTLKQVAGKVQVGNIPLGRFQVLQENKLLDLETLFAVDNKSPHYNERNRAGVFYAQSWGLTHMLNLSEEYRAGFSDFLRAITTGATSAEALQKAYKKSPVDVRKDFDRYLRGSRFFGALYDFKLDKSAELPETRPATPLASGLVLASLLTGAKRDQAKQAYTALAQAHPDSWEVAEALAYLAWRANQREEAREHFGRAVERGATNAKLYYDYAALIGASRAENAQVTALLSKAIALKPDYKEARLRLVWAMLSDRNWNEALKHLAELKQVDEKLAVSLFRAMAYANFHAGKQAEAVRAADRARQYAKTPEDITATEELKLLVNQTVAPPLERAAPLVRPAPVARRQEPQTEDEDRPRVERQLVKRESTVAESVDPSSSLRKPATLKIEGALEHFDCMGKTARLRIVAGGKRLSFAILEPASISIAGTGAGTFDFSCGPQQARPVALEYEPKEDKKLGTAGTLRSIEFR